MRGVSVDGMALAGVSRTGCIGRAAANIRLLRDDCLPVSARFFAGAVAGPVEKSYLYSIPTKIDWI